MMRPFVRQALPFFSGTNRRSFTSDANKASGRPTHLRIHKHEYGKLSSMPSSVDGQRGFTTSIRATHMGDAGSIDSPLIQSMENKVSIHVLILILIVGVVFFFFIVFGCAFPLYIKKKKKKIWMSESAQLTSKNCYIYMLQLSRWKSSILLPWIRSWY